MVGGLGTIWTRRRKFLVRLLMIRKYDEQIIFRDAINDKLF